jgi:predicted DNA-binding protein
MLTVSFDDLIEEQLNQLAKRTGKPASQFVIDLVLEYLEDAYDAALADAAMDRIISGESTTVPYSQIKAKYRHGVAN